MKAKKKKRANTCSLLRCLYRIERKDNETGNYKQRPALKQESERDNNKRQKQKQQQQRKKKKNTHKKKKKKKSRHTYITTQGAVTSMQPGKKQSSKIHWQHSFFIQKKGRASVCLSSHVPHSQKEAKQQRTACAAASSSASSPPPPPPPRAAAAAAAVAGGKQSG